MIDLTKVWKDMTGKEAVGEVSLGYATETYTDGCCEMCYSDVTETVFYLLNNNKRIRVSNYALNILEL